jgi:AGCS family alanine or glycine:cation symporter
MEFNPLPIILAAVGSFFLVKLRFFFILHPFSTASRGARAIKDKRAFKSFALALAGTLGVGNVFGVAIGIIIGGAGSLFWLFVSMFFAMVIKYAEVVITSDNLYHDSDTHGGIYYVIKSSFKKIGKLFSAIYSLCVLGLSLVMGAALQTDAVCESAIATTYVPRLSLAILFVVIISSAIIGGTRKIEKITAIIIPLTTIIYIFLTLCIVFLNLDGLGEVFKKILSSAFEVDSAIGGGIGFLIAAPLREGFARGILSNEAGAGTSSIAHARNGVLNPASAGILGIFEVWFDTGLLCMLTGLSILLSVSDPRLFDSGMELITFAVGNIFGTAGKYTVLFCVFAFAFATVVCWYYYGSEAWETLFGKKKRVVFPPLFLSFVFLGCYADSMALITVTDALMLVATILSLSALIKNSDRIKTLSENGGVMHSDFGRLKRFRVNSIKENVSSRGKYNR